MKATMFQAFIFQSQLRLTLSSEWVVALRKKNEVKNSRVKLLELNRKPIPLLIGPIFVF